MNPNMKKGSSAGLPMEKEQHVGRAEVDEENLKMGDLDYKGSKEKEGCLPVKKEQIELVKRDKTQSCAITFEEDMDPKGKSSSKPARPKKEVQVRRTLVEECEEAARVVVPSTPVPWPELMSAVSGPMPLPMPLAQPSQESRMATPGAYRAAPGMDGHRLETATLEPPLQMDRTPVHTSTPVAQAVDEKSPTAVALPEHSFHAKRGTQGNDDQKSHWKVPALVALVALATLFLILGFTGVFSNRNKEQTPTRDHPATNSSHPTDAQQGTTWTKLFGNLPTNSSTLQALQDPTSPQSLGLKWILQDPHSYPLSRLKQRYVLAVLYYSFNGTFWTYNNHWLDTNIHECEWFLTKQRSITGQWSEFDSPCANYTRHGNNSTTGSAIRVAEREEDHLYTRLWLRQNSVEGTIPDELYWLTSLTNIDLGFNPRAPSGTIATEIGQLTNLQELRMPTVGGFLFKWWSSGVQESDMAAMMESKSKRLWGTMPSEIAKLTQLRVLDVGRLGHQLTGSLPMEIFYQLTNLVQLTLTGNRFTGTIPSQIGLLSNLMVFTTAWNGFTGTLPTELGFLTRLMYSYMYYNQHTGTLPTELGRLTDIVWLELQGNQLTGPLPTAMGRLAKLQEFQLSNNHLSSTMPTEIGNMIQLHELNLGVNHLSGRLVSELGQLTALYGLKLQGNQLTGALLPDLPMLTNLQELQLQGNQLTGALLSELAQLTALQTLKLQENQFTGQLGQGNIGKLSQLMSLDLSSNSLTGTIPQGWGDLTALEEFLVHNNQISGTIPEDLSLWSSMQTLDVSKNNLSLSIPFGFYAWPNISYMNVSDNALLTGTIPDSFCLRTRQGSSNSLDLVLDFDCGQYLCGCNCSCALAVPQESVDGHRLL